MEWKNGFFQPYASHKEEKQLDKPYLHCFRTTRYTA